MKITDKLRKAEGSGKITYSLEYFPPKTEQGLINLFDRLDRMAKLNPDFVSCTWGAGGSTQDRSIEFCSTVQSVYGLDTLMHLTCTNMEKEKIDKALEAAKAAGICNILALRGDPPRGHEYWTPCENGFTHAIDLVKYIREKYDDYFCIGVAGYPEGHVDAVSMAKDMQYLKEKVDAGADFVLTQLFYNVDGFAQWIKECRKQGIKVPIIPGIMPIPTYQTFRRMINLCKLYVPPAMMEALDSIKTDDEKVKEFGVELAVKMISELHTKHNISNFHISTLNLERSTRLILQKLRLVPQEKPSSGETVRPPAWGSKLIEVNLAESWDEFPNGRYGDSRSPAFGENTFGQGHVLQTSEATRKWGYPKTPEDVTNLFTQYILGKLSSLPWCEDALHIESDVISQSLVEINRRGFWTVSSQPAVNGASSQDPVHGWGPKGGYVYQKAFIEFFVSDKQVKDLLKRLGENAEITYYAINQAGELLSNVTDPEAKNAVTWGVFPGKEIVQPTLIERLNFEAWKVMGDGLDREKRAWEKGMIFLNRIPCFLHPKQEEAYLLWAEWEQQYPRESDTAKLLKHIRDHYWLVNVVHNDFQQPDSLFDVMLSC
ncbi:methylenetetrahydrofolate reductase-domain-containing protein [Phycomyces nitens]|nr:methylenetetrahydrofolate reductase-domain-containing protein [Phycomyces nitens]